jgi:hypothetical protein
MYNRHVNIFSKNKVGISLLVLFVLFLFQQSLATSVIPHPSGTDHPTIGTCQNLTERLSVSLEKNKHRVFHIDSEIPVIFTPQLIRIGCVVKPRVALFFLPLSSRLVYTQYTSTYL